jgi:thioredoxin 2
MMVSEFYNFNQQSPKTSTRLAKVRRQPCREPDARYLIRMSELDDRGILLNCPKCGRRNRMRYEGLGQTFHCAQCKSELPPLNEPVDARSDLVFDALISRSKLPVLVDFWAPWCGPCKMVAPEFRKVAQETAGQFVLAKVNTEEVPSLAARFRITAIPTMTLFRNGLEVARQAGAMPAPQIRKFIEQAELAPK